MSEKAKDSWTREEVIKLIYKLDDDLRIHLDPNELDVWFKENLVLKNKDE